MSDRYELIQPQEIDGVTFYRIRALKYFGTQCPGAEGRLIEKAANLSQTGLSWVGYDSLWFMVMLVCLAMPVLESESESQLM